MSDSDVGSKKVHEDDRIAMWELVLQPGEATHVHTHRRPYTFYVIEGSTLEVYSKDDTKLADFTAVAGSVMSFVIEGEELVCTQQDLRFPVTHYAKNIGSGVFKELLVETKC